MTALIGSSGIALAQGVDAIPTNGTPVSEVIKIVVQVIIGIVTLLQMRKNRKSLK